MDKLYICTQCNAEYDAPGMCEMCDVELIPEKEDDIEDDQEKDTDRFGEFADEDDEIKDELLEKEDGLLEKEPYVEMNEDEENY